MIKVYRQINIISQRDCFNIYQKHVWICKTVSNNVCNHGFQGFCISDIKPYYHMPILALFLFMNIYEDYLMLTRILVERFF